MDLIDLCALRDECLRILIGGGTGRIGDPKPDAERELAPTEVIDERVEKLKKQALAENILITLDKEGVLIHAGVTNQETFETDRLSAMNPVVNDPAGAGDSLLTCSALAAASGADVWQCAYLGSLAAACQVERTGNIPISIKDMMAKMSK